jgi:hypothetical protein
LLKFLKFFQKVLKFCPETKTCWNCCRNSECFGNDAGNVGNCWNFLNLVRNCWTFVRKLKTIETVAKIKNFSKMMLENVGNRWNFWNFVRNCWNFVRKLKIVETIAEI